MPHPDTVLDPLIAELRQLAPAPDVGPVDDAGRTRMEARLLLAMQPTGAGPGERTRRRLRHAWPAAVVAACLVAVASLAALALTAPLRGGSPTALPVRAAPDAVRALDALATVAQTATTPVVADDQYVYVRSKVITNDGGLGSPVTLGPVHERQVWLSQATDTDEPGLIREFGQDWPIGTGGYQEPAGPERPTYAWISSLPTDPDGIIGEVRSHQLPGSGQTADEYVFERIGDILGEDLVPPDLEGALFRAVTKIPGVRFVPQAQDAIGRVGFGIARTDEHSLITTEWVFAPGSSETLGTRWYMSVPSESGRTDVLFGATAVLERSVADQVGVPPKTPPSAGSAA